jgi:hypothetical protein
MRPQAEMAGIAETRVVSLFIRLKNFATIPAACQAGSSTAKFILRK